VLRRREGGGKKSTRLGVGGGGAFCWRVRGSKSHISKERRYGYRLQACSMPALGDGFKLSIEKTDRENQIKGVIRQ